MSRLRNTDAGTAAITQISTCTHGTSTAIVPAMLARTHPATAVPTVPHHTREPVEILKAIDCYEHRACETPDRDQTEAHSFQADAWRVEEP